MRPTANVQRGADVSVFPKSYAGVRELKGIKRSQNVHAQGRKRKRESECKIAKARPSSLWSSSLGARNSMASNLIAIASNLLAMASSMTAEEKFGGLELEL